MRANVGSFDQAIRIIGGMLILWAGIHWNTWWGALGAIPFLTGLFRWCPAYSLFRVTTADDHMPHHLA